jgi:hypothetical protein
LADGLPDSRHDGRTKDVDVSLAVANGGIGQGLHTSITDGQANLGEGELNNEFVSFDVK